MAGGSEGPLWAQIADILRARIASGEATGDLSDVALASEFQISTGTARQAVRLLAKEGLLVRRRGLGTFVTSAPIRSELAVFGNFMVEWQLQGRSVNVELLERSTKAANMMIAAGLGVQPGEMVAYNHRRRLADGQPVAVDHRYIPIDLDEGLEEPDFLRESLWRALQMRKGVQPLESRVTVRATAADEEAVELLGLPLGAPILSHELQIVDTAGRIVMFGTTAYHPERFVYASVQMATSPAVQASSNEIARRRSRSSLSKKSND